MDTPVTVSMALTDDQALALAQFVKRVGWSEFRANAVDDNEAATIRSAVDALQKALVEAGYAPR
jgi:dissimilatory sulfite reductase (desulfoviridin) alpha/beta subunit